MTAGNVGTRYDRLPADASARSVPERPTRAEVLAFFEERYGIDQGIFENYTFWEKGTGKIWAFAGDVPGPVNVEALGIHLLRTNQHHWKPTTDAMQRFGHAATHNVVDLGPSDAARFWAGETQEIGRERLRGYVIVRRRMADQWEPLGVGLAVEGELRSQVPKGRRRDFRDGTG